MNIKVFHHRWGGRLHLDVFGGSFLAAKVGVLHTFMKDVLTMDCCQVNNFRSSTVGSSPTLR